MVEMEIDIPRWKTAWRLLSKHFHTELPYDSAIRLSIYPKEMKILC